MESSNSRFFKTLVLAAVIVGGIWVLTNKDRIREPEEVIATVQDRIEATQIGFGSKQNLQIQNSINNQHSGQTIRTPFKSAVHKKRQPEFVTNVIRIASFKVQPDFQQGQRATSEAMAIDLIADICRRYDAIAFQGIDFQSSMWLRRLTEKMNQIPIAGTPIAGRPAITNLANYAFISDRERIVAGETVSAIVFNEATLEMDRSQWYTVADPDNILTREPIVGWFRTRGPSSNEAFTFSLVNIKLDSRRPEMELGRIGDLYRAIRNDGRQEDDVLIVGDFNTADNGLRPMRKRNGLTWVVSNRATTTRYDSQNDNLVFNDVATVEFTGRGGVFDFMRHYNLRLDAALSVSEHMPVWGEFSIYEGTQ